MGVTTRTVNGESEVIIENKLLCSIPNVFKTCCLYVLINILPFIFFHFYFSPLCSGGNTSQTLIPEKTATNRRSKCSQLSFCSKWTVKIEVMLANMNLLYLKQFGCIFSWNFPLFFVGLYIMSDINFLLILEIDFCQQCSSTGREIFGMCVNPISQILYVIFLSLFIHILSCDRKALHDDWCEVKCYFFLKCLCIANLNTNVVILCIFIQKVQKPVHFCRRQMERRLPCYYQGTVKRWVQIFEWFLLEITKKHFCFLI